MTKEQRILTELLGSALGTGTCVKIPEQADWDKLLQTAERHKVLPLIYMTLEQQKTVPEQVVLKAQRAARKTVQQSYRLLFLSKYVVYEMEKAGFPVVLLKGVGTSSFYPEPELRKSGDIDLLLTDPSLVGQAEEKLVELGFRKKTTQSALHHCVMVNGEGIEAELHTMLAEPFDHSGVNRYLEELVCQCRNEIIRKEIMGIELPILSDAYHAFELLLHMLQHYLRAGFGLKLLCDWVVFWNRETERKEQEKYLQLASKAGVKGFSDMITLCCCEYLGLDRQKIGWMNCEQGLNVQEFLEDVLAAEEFGHSSAERMVTLQGNGILAYVREFHHQMHLNFPKIGKIFLFWPVLWVITLVRFLYNNKTVRKTSGMEILRSAGRRGKLTKQMNIFAK